jgi:hypothetical protein
MESGHGDADPGTDNGMTAELFQNATAVVRSRRGGVMLTASVV